MEILIKKAIKAGNSSAAILPRAWLNKEVRIELVRKTNKTILHEVLDILEDCMDLREIIGIYLSGSYARGESDEKSDIDVMVITQDTDKEMITEGIYSITIISEALLKQKLEIDLFPIGPMIKEAKTLLNLSYISSINVNVTKKNVMPYIDTTKEKLKLLRRAIDLIIRKNKKYSEDKVVYTLVLRIRTLELIRKLASNSIYSKKEFVRLIKDISKSDRAYRSYLNVKNNRKEENLTTLDEAERLYEYLRKQLVEIKEIIDKLR